MARVEDIVKEKKGEEKEAGLVKEGVTEGGRSVMGEAIEEGEEERPPPPFHPSPLTEERRGVIGEAMEKGVAMEEGEETAEEKVEETGKEKAKMKVFFFCLYVG